MVIKKTLPEAQQAYIKQQQMPTEVVKRPTNMKTIRTYHLICKGYISQLDFAHSNEFESSWCPEVCGAA